MSKKIKYAIVFGVFGTAVVLAAVALYMVSNRGYHAYAGEWEMEKGYIYSEDSHQYEEIPLDGTRHIRNKETKEYEVKKTKRGTFKIDHEGNFIETGFFGEQDKGKLKIRDGKVCYTGKCQSGNFQWDFEKSGDRMVLYESVDPSSADDNVIVLATKTKYIYVRKVFMQNVCISTLKALLVTMNGEAVNSNLILEDGEVQKFSPIYFFIFSC